MSDKRLIDANVLYDTISDVAASAAHDVMSVKNVHEYIEAAPTIDAVEVVHGHWIDRIEIFSDSEGPVRAIGCSKCGESQREFRRTPYCPICGAKMDGGAE